MHLDRNCARGKASTSNIHPSLLKVHIQRNPKPKGTTTWKTDKSGVSVRAWSCFLSPSPPNVLIPLRHPSASALSRTRTTLRQIPTSPQEQPQCPGTFMTPTPAVRNHTAADPQSYSPGCQVCPLRSGTSIPHLPPFFPLLLFLPHLPFRTFHPHWLLAVHSDCSRMNLHLTATSRNVQDTGPRRPAWSEASTHTV